MPGATGGQTRDRRADAEGGVGVGAIGGDGNGGGEEAEGASGHFGSLNMQHTLQ